MSQVILFDGPEWENLFPLTLTRPVGHIRIGISTICEKWEKFIKKPIYLHTIQHLKGQYQCADDKESILINGSVLPSDNIYSKIKTLEINEAICHKGNVIALRVEKYDPDIDISQLIYTEKESLSEVSKINYPEDILNINDKLLSEEIYAHIQQHTSHELDPTIAVIGDKQQVYIENSVSISHCTLNVSHGPIYIAKNATIMEGAMLRGPLYIGTNSVIKMGAKIYGNTSIGPQCKIGGEVKRTIVIGNSNKGHEGFVGDSVIGEWCNFGADSNTSNMKNTYGKISLYDIARNKKRITNNQFLGLMMGDHSKCAINTQFNTGTVVGVFANIFGAPPLTYIPSFSWGKEQVYDINKALEVANIVYGRRNRQLSDSEKDVLKKIYQQYRIHDCPS